MRLFSAIIYLRNYPGNDPQAIQKRERAYSQLNLHDRSNPEELEEMRQYGGYLMALEASHASALCTYGELNALGK